MTLAKELKGFGSFKSSQVMPSEQMSWEDASTSRTREKVTSLPDGMLSLSHKSVAAEIPEGQNRANEDVKGDTRLQRQNMEQMRCICRKYHGLQNL